MFVSVQKNLQHINICTLRMSTSFEYIVDTSEKTESLLSERIAEQQKGCLSELLSFERNNHHSVFDITAKIIM